VAAHEVVLEGFECVGGNLDVGKGAEAGVDAVRRVVVGRPVLDDVARGANACGRRRRDVHQFAVVHDGEQIVKRERAAVEQHHGGRCLCAPAAAAGCEVE
jgi:hypothetical protein